MAETKTPETLARLRHHRTSPTKVRQVLRLIVGKNVADARETLRLSRETGIDAAPEGGCALGVLEKLVRAGAVARDAEVVLFNTGSGASYRF